MTSEALRPRLEALHPECFGWALACCGRDRDAALEVLQMSYVKVLDGRAVWDGRSTFRTWFFSVIRNTALERRRREWLTGKRLSRWWGRRPDPDVPPGPEAAASTAESADRLKRALARLSGRQRGVLQLVFYHDLTIDDAARVLGLAPGTARLHYARGKRRLREALLEGPRPRPRAPTP